MAFKSRFDGANCIQCGAQIKRGDYIAWSRHATNRRYWHLDCAAPKADPSINQSQTVGSGAAAVPGAAAAAADSTALGTLATALLPYLDGKFAKATDIDAVVELLDSRGPRKIEVTVGSTTTAIEGHVHAKFQEVLELVAAGINVLMVGPAGCGKTHLAGQVAKALGKTFYFNSLTAGTSEGQLLGRLLPTGEAGRFEYHPSPFIRAYEGPDAGVWLGDELDGADSNALLCINAALANGHTSVPNRVSSPTAARHEDFRCIAAANTYGTGANRMYVGRNQLDESTLDRFRAGQVELDYDRNLEAALLPDAGLLDKIWAVRRKADDLKLRRVVSTRFVADAGRLLGAGKSHEYILGQLTRGWSAEERSKV